MDEEANRMDAERDKSLAAGTPRWMWLAMVLLAGISCVAVALGWKASSRAASAEAALAAQTQAFVQELHRLQSRIAEAEASSADLENELSAVASRVQMTQGEVRATRGQTTQIREEYAQRLDGVQSELAAKASAEELSSLGDEVDGVKTELEVTQSGLQMTRGEFGTLIARNSEEIEELRRLGERDYHEFTLIGKGTRTRLGNLMLELRGTNTKRNQFTVALYVDDMRLEKKNRAVDEPIFFYTREARSPLELVVNRVGKDTIVGYLSVPKARAATVNAAAALD